MNETGRRLARTEDKEREAGKEGDGGGNEADQLGVFRSQPENKKPLPFSGKSVLRVLQCQPGAFHSIFWFRGAPS